MKRTYQPSQLVRKRRHGFRSRMATVGGRKVLNARRAKGRARLSAQFLKLKTLNKTSEFTKVKKLGKFISRRGFNGYFIRQELDSLNFFGIVVSKRIGNAVKRNYTKRRVREAIRNSLVVKSTKKLKLVLIMKKNVLDLAFIDLKSDIDKFLTKANEIYK